MGTGTVAQNVSLLVQYVSLIKSLKVQEKSFQAFLCLLECSRVGKRTKVCKLEPPGTLIKSAYLSPMVPRGCSPLDRYSCSSGKLGNGGFDCFIVQQLFLSVHPDTPVRLIFSMIPYLGVWSQRNRRFSAGKFYAFRAALWRG